MRSKLVLAALLLALIVPSACGAPIPPTVTPPSPEAEPAVASPLATPVATPTAVPEPESPAQVVEAFYSWYLETMGDRMSGEFRNPLVEKFYRESPYLTQSFVERVDEIIAGFDQAGGGYDPFLCAQDVPTQLSSDGTFLAGDLAGGTASVLMRSDFEGHYFTVDLQPQEDGQWRIGNVTCGNTPTGLAKAFYTWYLGYIGDRFSDEFRNPLVDRAYRDSGFLTEAFIQRVDELLDSFAEGGGGYDPFLLAQDIPQGFSVDPGLTEDTAIVHELFGPDSVRHLQVTTVAENGKLLIDDIAEASAPPGTAPAAAEPDAGAEPALPGRWEGSLSIAGLQLGLVITFEQDGDALTGSMDIPAQGAVDIPLADVRYTFPRLTFSALSGPQQISFVGEMAGDNAITGTISQAGYEGTFELERVQETSEVLPYEEEEVTFQNGDIVLAGTLTLPPGDGPHPAMVLISGSGQQNRDEEISIVPGYRPFRTIADHLTRQGIAVLRYDDRGFGGSSGDPTLATTADFAEDGRAALTYLRSRPDIDPDQVGLLGHSEGGMIAASLAAGNPEVAFVVSMAGDAVNGYEILLKQVERLARASGFDEAQVAQAVEQQRNVLDMALAQDWEGLQAFVENLLLEQLQAMPEDQQAALGDLEAVARERAAIQVEAIQSPWYQAFLAYDPAEHWAQVTAPVLALFGTLDVQVDAEQNRTALEAALAEAGNEDVTVVVFPEANHLFQAAITGNVDEYPTLAVEFVPGFLDTITGWLLERVTLMG